MIEVLIHMKSGKTLKLRGKKLDMKVDRDAYHALVGLAWEGIEYGDDPVFIDLDQVECISTTLNGVSDGVA